MICLAICAIWMSGCQDYNVPIAQTNTGTSAGGTITISPAGLVFVDVGRTRQMLVTVTSDSAAQGVTWALSGPGSLSGITTTTATYTGSMNAGDTATITATGVANPTEIVTASLYMVPLPTIPTTTLPAGTIGAAYNGIVNEVNGSAPFTWSVASGSLPPGITFSQTSLSAISFEGSPTCPGGAATCTTQTYNFTMQLDDVTSAIAKQSFSITINGTGSANSSALKTLAGGGVNNSLVQGDYAFRFGGFNSQQGMTASAGSFSADGNGNIVGGLVDRTGVAGGPQHGLALTGTYSIGANNLGVMTLNFADGSTGTYAIAVSADGSARFIEFDATATVGTNGSGDMKKQDPTSLASLKVAGNYVFQLAGVDSQGARMAAAGAFTVNDAGTMSSGVADINDAGTVANAPFTGNFAQTTSGARTAEIDFDPKASVGIVSDHLSLYPVSADEFFAVETDAAGQPVMIGSIVRQSAASFTSASFAGNGILQATGFSNGETQMIFGMIAADATSGASALSAAELSGGGASELNAKYTATVGANGRVALTSIATTSNAAPSSVSSSPIIYLVRPNAGFVLGTDVSVMVGWTQAQSPTSSTISAASFSGTIAGASVFPAGPSMTQSVVTFAFDGKGTVSGTGATSGPNGQALLPILQGTYTVGSGDIFMSVTWPLQTPQPMLILNSGKLMVVPPDATYAPIAVKQ
jgi:large repetitive protein